MRDPKELKLYPNLDLNNPDLINLICAAYPNVYKEQWVGIRRNIKMAAELRDIISLYQELGWLKLTCSQTADEERPDLIITTISLVDAIYEAENKKAVCYLNQIVADRGWEVSSWLAPEIKLSAQSFKANRGHCDPVLYLVRLLVGHTDSIVLYKLILKLDANGLNTLCIRLTKNIETKLGGSLTALQLILHTYAE
jgi:hypothetical protein